MDAEKHVREKERINKALLGRLSELQAEMEQLFEKYYIASMPGLSHDVCHYVIEELHLQRLNIREY